MTSQQYSLAVIAIAAAFAWSGCAVAEAPGGPGEGDAQSRASSAPTPLTSDGRPDLTGLWGVNGLPIGAQVDEQGNVSLPFGDLSREGKLVNFERDSGIVQRAHANKPLYKPEYWDKVQQLDQNGNKEDPTFGCMPAGVPRLGPPGKIVQTPTETLFFYNRYDTGNAFRVIYTDGRSHHPEKEWLSTWHGHSIGRWDGDTFVIETIDFTDESWLDWPGYFHSTEMRVVERIRREGDVLHYQVTVEDPELLLEPWVRDEVLVKRNPDPKAEFIEELPCSERDREHIVTKERG